MKVLTSHKATDINDIAKNNIEKESLIITDKSTSYEDFSRMFDTNISFQSDKTTTKTSLKWVHVAISNAKRNLLGVYHMISNEYLQNYLNEFCYRLNRRYFGENLFNRTVVAVLRICSKFENSQLIIELSDKKYYPFDLTITDK